MFDRRVTSAAEKLRNLGVTEGDQIGLVLPDSLDYAVVIVALLRLKAVAFLVDPRLEARMILRHPVISTCMFLVLADDSRAAGDLSELHCVKLGEIVDWHAAVDPDARPAQLSLEQDATMVMTPGNMDKPKTVLHALENHLFSAAGANEIIPFEPGDQWLMSRPFHHIGGLAMLFRSLAGGGALVLPAPGASTVEILRAEPITHMAMTTLEVQRFVREEIPVDCRQRLKAILIHGGNIPKPVREQALHLDLPLCQSYGLTEMASAVTISSPTDRRTRLSTAGKPLKYGQVRTSETGEILVKGGTLFKGYRAASGIVRPLDAEGWLHTGDLGRMTEAGDLIVAGRRDNTFNTTGGNIQPEEIEIQLVQMGGIEEAVVVAINTAEQGLRPFAFVRTESGGDIDTGNIVRHLEANLADYKIPVAICPWPDGVEASSGKVIRVQLAALAEAYDREFRR